MCAADRVRDLHLAAIRQPGGDQVLRHVPGGVCGRPVDLARVLAAERAATVPRHAAVRVDDDLAPGESRVSRRPAQHEVAAGVDHDLGRGVDDLSLQHGIDYQLTHAFRDLFLGRARGMVGRHDDGLDPLWFAVLVLDGDLRLAVGPQERQRTVPACLGEPFRQLVGERDGQRHELGRLAAREADHHALVPRALQLEWIVVQGALACLERVAHAGRDIGRLFFEVDLDQRMVGVESDLFVVVADRSDRVADGALDVELRVRGHLTDHDAQPFRDRGFARDTGVRVLPEHAVEHRIGNLVADLVGMPFGDGLGGQQIRGGCAEGGSHNDRTSYRDGQPGSTLPAWHWHR